MKKIKSLASKRFPFMLGPNDPSYELGKNYHYFGIMAMPNMSVGNPQQVVTHLMKMSTYCRRNFYQPVVVFYEPNTELAGICKRLGLLTVCATKVEYQMFDKSVDCKDAFQSLRTVYWVRLPESDMPEVLELIEDSDGTIIPVDGKVPDVPLEDKRVQDPNSLIKKAQPAPADTGGDNAYENFPLGDQSTPLDEPSLPLELPDGIMDIMKQSELEGQQVQDSIRTRNKT